MEQFVLGHRKLVSYAWTKIHDVIAGFQCALHKLVFSAHCINAGLEVLWFMQVVNSEEPCKAGFAIGPMVFFLKLMQFIRWYRDHTYSVVSLFIAWCIKWREILVCRNTKYCILDMSPRIFMKERCVETHILHRHFVSKHHFLFLIVFTFSLPFSLI